VAAALRIEPGLQVQMVDGNRGELTVLVDGKEVARKQGDSLPPVQEVVTAVKKAGAATAGVHA
jgi:hypothetical protein